MGALFEFEEVTVAVDDGRDIVKVEHLVIPDQGITVIVGPSGAGKSTLLRLCNRLTAPTSGRILFLGEDLAGLDPLSLRRRVGMVFQQPVLFPGSGLDNLRVGDPEITVQAGAELLERVGLPDGFLSRRTDDLSGGEAQRLCLARTLTTGPEVLLMDEPTASLDPAASGRLEHLVRRLAGDGVPVLWVTHDVEQVRRLADRVMVMTGGELSAEPDKIAAFLDGEEA